MTKALFRETLRSIRRTKARFISLIAIVALGISFFAGIKAAYPDMHETAVRYYEKNNLMDIWMISTIGFTDYDVDQVKKVEGVKNAYGSKFIDSAVKVDGEIVSNTGGSQMVCRAYGFNVDKATAFEAGEDDPSYINRLTLLDGRYPQKSGECLVDRNSVATPKEFVMGKTITLEGIEKSFDGKLSTKTFKIVGVIETPRYVSIERGQTTVGNGSLGCFIYIPDTAFTFPFYSELCVTVKDADSSEPYSEDYFNSVETVMERIKAISQSCLKVSAGKVIEYVSRDLNEKKNEYNEAAKAIEAQLASASQRISSGEEELIQGEAQLKSAKEKANTEFKQKYKELLDGDSKYSAGLNEYNEKYAKYLEQKQLFEAAKAAADSSDSLNTLLQKLNYTQSANEQIDTLKAEIADLESAISSLKNEIGKLTSEKSEKASDLSDLQNAMASEDEDITFDFTNEINLLINEISDIENKIERKTQQLDSYSSELLSKQTKISDLTSNPNYTTNLTALNISIAALRQGNAYLDYLESQLNNAEKELANAKKELDDAGLKLSGGWEEYNSMLAKTQDQLTEGESKIASGRTKLEESKSEYSKQVVALKEKQDEALYQIKEAEELIAAGTNNRNWYVYDRNSIPGYEGYGQTSENMKAFATIFPLFFFVVAALVCLTTMTRMVDEERTQLGTLKALGYSEISIRQKYLFYSFLASIIGSAIGLSVGLVVFPKAIFSAYGLMYNLPDLVILYPWQYMLSGTLFAMISTMSVSYIACRKEMKSVPAQLMRPKAPKAGKRIFLEKMPFIWKRMNFTSKVTARNIIRNKKRFIMTLIGIGGCTALLLTGFGLSDSINAIITTQYGRDGLIHADCQIAFKNSQTYNSPKDKDSVYNRLVENEYTKDVMMFYSKSVTAFSDTTDENYSVNFFVPQANGLLSKFVVLQDRLTKTPYSLTDNGVLITEKIASKLGVKVGENIKIKFSESDIREFPVSAIVENYTYHYVYISPASYYKTFNEAPKFNYAFVNYVDNISNSEDVSLRDDAQKSLLNNNYEVTAVIDIVQTSDSFSRMFRSLDYVIMVFIVSAALLAFVVLYNLTNININERKREIATLKVLGFQNYESTSYIGRENLVITVLGTIGGLIVGVFLHRFVIEMAEVNVVMFGRTINLMSYVWAVVLTFIFSIIVSIIMSISIKRIHMVESLKSIE